MTIKEVRELIEHYSFYGLEEYLQGHYTEEEKEGFLSTFICEDGVCHWTIEENVYY